MITDEELGKIENVTVFDGLIKARAVLRHHKKVVASISGGSDSDIVLDILEKCRNDENEISYIWFDTGVEYKATKEHLKYLEERYGITIERVRAIKTIPTCCREYGQPFLSKYVSENMMRLQALGFKWEDEPLDVLMERYEGTKAALRWWTNDFMAQNGGVTTRYDIARNKWLKEFIIRNPPTFDISNKCCTYAKKAVVHKYMKGVNADLNVFGVRRTEGGVRSRAYKNCYSHSGYETPEYRPVFWYTDDDKRYYEEHFGIVHSDCYTKYGLKRTGCVGCPYGRDVLKEIALVEAHEPNLIKACRHVFKDSYEYTRKYHEFYAIMQDNQKHQISGQATIYDYIREEK